MGQGWWKMFFIWGRYAPLVPSRSLLTSHKYIRQASLGCTFNSTPTRATSQAYMEETNVSAVLELGPSHQKLSNTVLGHEILVLSSRSSSSCRPQSWKLKNLQDLSTLLFAKHRRIISSKAYKVCFLLSSSLNFPASITGKKNQNQIAKDQQKKVFLNKFLSLLT